MAGTPAFKNYPLWEAYYVNYTPPDPGMATFGGWDQRRAWQYTDKGRIAGWSLDLSVVDDVWLYSKPEVPVTDEQMAEVQRIAQDEIIRNIDKALAEKRLPAGSPGSPDLRRAARRADARAGTGAGVMLLRLGPLHISWHRSVGGGPQDRARYAQNLTISWALRRKEAGMSQQRWAIIVFFIAWVLIVVGFAGAVCLARV
jgi:hypothetical protein